MRTCKWRALFWVALGVGMLACSEDENPSASPSGGMLRPSTGGAIGSGGAGATGGETASGGATPNGGADATGGTTATGGVAASGGDMGLGDEDAGTGAGGEFGEDLNTGGTEPLPPLPDDKALPFVFVHGGAGSASQYESQAMRLVANGYPQDRIYAYEYPSIGGGADQSELDDFIDRALADHGASQIYLAGHSLGTTVSSTYLGSSARAAKVAKSCLSG